MPNVGYASLQVIPTMRGAQGTIARELAGLAGPADKTGRSIGGKIMSGAGVVLKRTAVGVGVAAGGVLGTALFKGFNRLNAIDQAQAKLRGLGHSTRSVAKIMDNALASVQGTAFGLGDAATIAASSVASGVKPGKDLTRTLKLIADAATIGGTSLSDMGLIFNKVAATGKVDGEVLAQLGERGIPILQLLGKELGKTPAQVAKLASQGKVDFKTFQDAMEEGLGGAALKSGDTFSGAFANMGAALGRFGAKLLGGFMPTIKDVFGDVTGLLDRATQAVTPFADAVAAKLPGAIDSIKGFFTAAVDSDTAQAAFDGISSAAGKIRDALGAAVTKFDELKTGADGIDLGKIDAKGLGQKLGTALVTAIETIGKASGKILGALKAAFAKVDWVGLGLDIGKQVPALLVGLAAGILNFDLAGLLTGLGEHWGDIVLAILAIAFAPAKIAGKLGAVLAKIPFVGKFLETSVLWLNNLGSRLLGFGGDLLRMFWRGFTEAPIPGVQFVGKVIGSIKSLPGRMRDFLSTLGTRIGVWALDAFEAMGRSARGATSRAANAVVSAVKGIPGRIRSVGGALKSAGSWIMNKFWEGMKSIAGKAGDIARGLWNGVKGFLNSAIDKINAAIPNQIGKGPIKINLPDNPFPKFARGVTNFRGGYAWVGEEGRELVRLPSGSDVIPHDESMRMVGQPASRGDIAINTTFVQQPGQSDRDAGDAMANRILWAMAATAG